MRTAAIVAPLLLLLGLSFWFAYATWTAIDAPPIPAIGWAALIGGVVVSLALGVGLMALVFHSHRRGYDEIEPRSRGERR